MPIAVRCENCGHILNVPDQFIGRRGKCKKCGALMRLDVPASPPAKVAESPPARVTVEDKPLVPLVERRDFPATRPPPSPLVVMVSGTPALPETPGASIPCPFCAEPIQPAAKKCRHCREYLDPVLRKANERQAGLQAPQVIVNNVATANAKAVSIAGGRRRWSRLIAGLLSLVLPGAGQLYKGQFLNAIVWFAAVICGYVAFIVPGAILHLLCVLGAVSGDNGG